MKHIIKLVSIVLLSFFIFLLFALFLNFESVLEIIAKDNTIKTIKEPPYTKQEKALVNDLQTNISMIESDLNITKDVMNMMSEADDYAQSNEAPPPPQPQIAPPPQEITKQKEYIKPKTRHNTPKLVIIIDDIVNQGQVNTLNNIGLKLTLSFLPPTAFHKDSARIALKQPSHMVHLPLEAMNYAKNEMVTLRTTNSKAEIEDFIKTIREKYPRARYMNNHTGSKFTADYASMETLITTLKKYQFKFVDSRTTPHTKANEVGQNLGMEVLSRDIFLDNNMEKEYVQSQLDQAIKKAKSQGYAIAIGHPHPATIEALTNYKDKLTNEIDVIYIEELL